jgi:hypothetical protein
MKTKPELGPLEEDRYYGTTANRESCSVLFYYEDEDHESLQTLSLKHPSMGREVRDRSATMVVLVEIVAKAVCNCNHNYLFPPRSGETFFNPNEAYDRLQRK